VRVIAVARAVSFAALLRKLDHALLRILRTRGHWPPLERGVANFSRLGEHSAIWFAAAAAGTVFDKRHRPVYARLARTLATVEVANALLKLAILRPRPQLDGLPALVKTRSQRSLPSAHAATSFAAARVLAGTAPPAGVYAVAAAMALSRPYLGVHYPSDVIVGAAVGTVIAERVGGGSLKAGRDGA
jgi:membrane-associated phospholipid phosphatase